MARIVVVGAGLSGLVVGDARSAAGDDVVVLEARERHRRSIVERARRTRCGQFGELGAETMYRGHDNVLALTRRLELDAVACGYFDPAAPPMLFGGQALDEEARREITGWLLSAYRDTPPAPFENLEAWTARLHAPAEVVAFLTAFTQYNPGDVAAARRRGRVRSSAVPRQRFLSHSRR